MTTQALQAAREALAEAEQCLLSIDKEDEISAGHVRLVFKSLRENLDSLLSSPEPATTAGDDLAAAVQTFLATREAVEQETANMNEAIKKSLWGMSFTVPTPAQKAHEEAEAALRLALDVHRSARQAIPSGLAEEFERNPHLTGASLAFEGGSISVNRDGTALFAFGEQTLGYEPHEEGGHLTIKIDATEIIAIAEFIFRWTNPAIRDALRAPSHAVDMVEKFLSLYEQTYMRTDHHPTVGEEAEVMLAARALRAAERGANEPS